MVRSTTATDDESFETITAPDAVEVGDTVDVEGPSFLPKSNLEVVEVDRSPARYEDAYGYDNPTTFVARIPGRSNARDYCFLITDGGFVKTTGSSGVYDTAVTAKVRRDAASKTVDDAAAERFDADDRVNVEYTHDLKGDDTGTIIAIHARDHGIEYVVDVDDGGHAYVTADRLTPLRDADAYTVRYRNGDAIEVAHFAGSAACDAFVDAVDGDVVDVTCHANDGGSK